MTEQRESIIKHADPYLRELRQRLKAGESPGRALSRVLDHLEISVGLRDREDPVASLTRDYLRDQMLHLVDIEPKPIRISLTTANTLIGALQGAVRTLHDRAVQHSRYDTPRDRDKWQAHHDGLRIAEQALQGEIARVKQAAAGGLTLSDVVALREFDERISAVAAAR